MSKSKSKSYKYFCSFIACINNKDCFGNCVLVGDKPLDTMDMLYKAKRDIANELKDCSEVTIIFFKRIKDVL